jgi:hypothetical protein
VKDPLEAPESHGPSISLRTVIAAALCLYFALTAGGCTVAARAAQTSEPASQSAS